MPVTLRVSQRQRDVSMLRRTTILLLSLGAVTSSLGAQAPTRPPARRAAPEVAREAQRAPLSRSKGPPDQRRFQTDSFWVRLWRRGGKDEPELFVEPRHLTTFGNLVAVLDLGTREVIAFDRDSGRTQFTMSARGEGPGEFKRPALLVSDGASFGVIDHATSRLSMYDTRGTLRWDAPLPDAANLESACLLSGARVLMKVAGIEKAIRVVDSTGRTIAQRTLDGYDRDHPPPAFAASARLSGPLAGDRCALVPSFGSTWYTTNAVGTMMAHPYIEAGAEAVVRVATNTLDKNWRSEVRKETQTSTVSPIARGALHIGDTLIVQAGATQRAPYRLLDYYLPSGRYLYSRVLPIAFVALAVGANGTFYGAAIDDEVSWIVAFRPTRVAPRSR